MLFLNSKSDDVKMWKWVLNKIQNKFQAIYTHLLASCSALPYSTWSAGFEAQFLVREPQINLYTYILEALYADCWGTISEKAPRGAANERVMQEKKIRKNQLNPKECLVFPRISRVAVIYSFAKKISTWACCLAQCVNPLHLFVPITAPTNHRRHKTHGIFIPRMWNTSPE